MKLIITGATGFVATEVLRQALNLPSITSVIAIARNSVSVPEGLSASNASKLRSIVVQDYGSYPEDVRNELEGADACIWTVAVTPNKARALPIETVHKVCQEWTLAGFNAILDANPNPAKPFRFLYMSGSSALDPAHPRSKEVKVWAPKYMEEYSNLRGVTATKIFELAAKQPSRIEVCVAKPGFITSSQRSILQRAFGTALWLTGAVETIDLREVSAAMLHQVVQGFEGTEGILLNSEMVKVGKEVLRSNENA